MRTKDMTTTVSHKDFFNQVNLRMRTKDMTIIACHRDFFNQVNCACAQRI
jgi:hypothetical protein